MSYKINVYKTDILFPYEHPYQAQIAIMANSARAFSEQKNALLESPTGTGKSLALLASSLAFQDTCLKKSETGESPKIYYSSRTHSQLKQVVSEYKKLVYHPQMSILAARSNMCIYEPVYTKKNVDYHCRTERHNCPYAKEGGTPPDDLLDEKFDIDDLKEYGLKNNRCPFMIAREMAKTAKIVFCPYNYIIDQQIREHMKINLPGSIVIIDEAHNIENVCRETAKFKMSVGKIMEMKKEIVKAMQVSHENNEWLTMLQPHLNSIDHIIQRMLGWLNNKRNATSSNEDYIIERDELTTLGGWLLNSKTWPNVQESINLLIHSDKKTKSRMPDSIIIPLTKLYGTLNSIFKNNAANLHDFKIACKFNRTSHNTSNDELMIICMIPSIVFHPISEQAHSVILSSGTLSPLDSFAYELGTEFPIKLSTNHIIQQNQVEAFTIQKSIDGSIKLSSSNENLKNNRDRIIMAIGFIIEKLLRNIPDGVLMFVPSYDFLNHLIEKWISTKFFSTLLQIKPIFYEEKGKDISILIQNYKKKVQSGCGGFFIGVCRGKISEGIDFTDAQARAVIVFGIPYPSFYSPDVQLKREYNDSHSSGYSKVKLMTGNNWYDSQAYRSLFQSIGRCIRHRNDYGSIILIDERFPDIIKYFPAWVERSYLGTLPIDNIIHRLKTFYSTMRIEFPISFGASLSLEFPLDLRCSQCGEKAIGLHRLNPKAKVIIDKHGFLSIFGFTEPKKCFYVFQHERGELYAIEGDLEFFKEDEIAYRTISCRCGARFGVKVNSVPFNEQKYCDAMWLLPETLDAVQGSNQQQLEVILQDES